MWGARRVQKAPPAVAPSSVNAYALLLPLVFVALALAAWFIRRRRAGRRDEKLPKGTYTVVPSTDETLTELMAGTHDRVTALHDAHGDLFAHCGALDGNTVVFVRGADQVKQVLFTDAFNPEKTDPTLFSGMVRQAIDLVQPMVMGSIFTFQEKEWRRRYRTLSPIFAMQDGRAAAFMNAAEEAVERLAKEAAETGQVTVDMSAWATHLLQLMSLHFAIGPDASRLVLPGELEAFAEAVVYFEERYASSEKPCLAELVGNLKISSDDTAVMTRMMEVARKIVRRAQSHADGEEAAEAKRGCPGCLQLMLEDGGYEDEEMAATIVNVVIAGAESNAAAVTALLDEVSRRADVQARIVDEVATALEPAAAGFGVPELKRLEFCGACVNEALRLHPPATIILRSVVKPEGCAIQRGDSAGVPSSGKADTILFPKGTLFAICPPSVHHDERQWGKDASEFNPDRYAAGQPAKKHSYLPFSGGRRGCPGRAIFDCQGQVILAALCRAFELAPAPAKPDASAASADAFKWGKGKLAKFVNWSNDPVVLQLTPRHAAIAACADVAPTASMLVAEPVEAVALQMAEAVPVEKAYAVPVIQTVEVPAAEVVEVHAAAKVEEVPAATEVVEVVAVPAEAEAPLAAESAELPSLVEVDETEAPSPKPVVDVEVEMPPPQVEASLESKAEATPVDEADGGEANTNALAVAIAKVFPCLSPKMGAATASEPPPMEPLPRLAAPPLASGQALASGGASISAAAGACDEEKPGEAPPSRWRRRQIQCSTSRDGDLTKARIPASWSRDGDVAKARIPCSTGRDGDVAKARIPCSTSRDGDVAK